MINRDELQEKWSNEYLDSNRKNILHITMRVGKCRIGIKILEKLENQLNRKPKVLISYPDKNIEESWKNDFKKWNYENENVEFITHISLHKVIKNNYDIIIVDEIHLLSENQKTNFNKLINNNKKSAILGLTGTMSEKTKLELYEDCGLKVLVNYYLEDAVNDKIISDYKIHIIKTDLDNKVIKDHKKNRTEKEQYRVYSWIIENKGPGLFINLARMRVIHNSIAKINKTKKVLEKLKDERVLIFCANNKVAKELKCKIHTTKFNNQDSFDKFTEGKGNNHLAVCKIGNTGVSFKNLNHIVIQAFDSNSENLTQRIARSLILEDINIVSNIYIITSKEKAELNWLNKSLEFFNKDKIKYYE